MARHKDFTGGDDVNEYEPVTFSLNGERFQAVPAIPGSVLLDFVAKADSDSGGAAAGALYGFFKDCMEPEEYERLMAVFQDKQKIIRIETIGEIVGYLVEEYSSRPTKQPDSSADGRSTSGPVSMVQPY